MKRIISAGFKVVPQWQVGGCRIDMVVEGSGKRLAVECDGEKWHTAENLSEDMNRQAILERLGWTFVRIRGSEFYQDPDKAMKIVFDRLSKLGIAPELNISDVSNYPSDDKILRDDVVRRADAILRSWNEEDSIYEKTEDQIRIKELF